MLPLFPSYVSFITGMSVADLTADLTAAARRRVLIHAVAFVLGFSLVFVALGASFSAAGQFLLDYRDWIRRIGGALIVIFGLYIVGVLRIGFFGRSQQWQLREKPAGYLGSLAVGITFAIGWTPCVGPDPRRDPVAGRYGRDGPARHRPAGRLLGGARAAVPDLGGRARTVPRHSSSAIGRFIPVVERAAGVVLVVVGVLVFTNYYVVLNSWAISLTPDWLLKRL